MYGIGPVIIAIVAQALWKLGRSAMIGVFPVLVALVVTGLALAGFDELALLAGAAVASLATGVARRGTAAAVLTVLVTAPATLGALALQTATEVPVTLTRLGLFFLKVGSVLFGQRLRAPRVLASRPDRRVGLADRPAADRRDHGRSGHAGTSVHHGDLHRLPARRVAGRRGGHRPESSRPASCSWRSRTRSSLVCARRRSPVPCSTASSPRHSV